MKQANPSRKNITIVAALSLVAGALWHSIAAAQTSPESRLRDALLNHFTQQNLLPVFLPRDHSVGDVLEPSGAFHARRKDCFPKLSLAQPKPSDSLKTLVVVDRAEGNFGVGIKRLFDALLKVGGTQSSKMTISFFDQTFVSATTADIKRSYSAANCPSLRPLIDGGFMAATGGSGPLFVLQEVYYARKRVSVDLDGSVNADVAIKEVGQSLAPLQLDAKLSAGSTSDSSIVIESKEPVPIAVRVAFLPRTITGVTLGGKGEETISGFLWQPATSMAPVVHQQALAAAARLVSTATSGASNPLLNE